MKVQKIVVENSFFKNVASARMLVCVGGRCMKRVVFNNLIKNDSEEPNFEYEKVLRTLQPIYFA